jgi:hypothetical protein
MLCPDSVKELQASWIPNITDSGLDRLINLLETSSPLLIHGSFTRSVPMGCLATHAAWHHPETAPLTIDAGINWLHRVAGLNPATSLVIRDWDCSCAQDWETRGQILQLLREEREHRQHGEAAPAVRLDDVVVISHPECEPRKSSICKPQSAI